MQISGFGQESKLTFSSEALSGPRRANPITRVPRIGLRFVPGGLGNPRPHSPQIRLRSVSGSNRCMTFAGKVMYIFPP